MNPKLDVRRSSLVGWLESHLVWVFFFWSLWLSFMYFSFGPMSYVRIHDIGDSNLPARLALPKTSQDGVFSYWNSLAAAGSDRLAIGYTSELDTLLYLILPGWLAYGIFMWMQRFIAGYFMTRLLRDTLGVGIAPSIFAGLAYSIFAQGQINNGWAGFTLYDGLAIPGLPFVLWLLSTLNFGRRYQPYLIVMGLGILLGMTSHFAMSLFIWPVIFVWFLVVSPQREFRFWFAVTVMAASWLLVEIPSVWVSLVNAPSSHRADWDLNHPLFGSTLDKARFAFNIARENALLLVIALAGLLFSRGRDRRLIVIIAGIVIGLGFIATYPVLRTILSGFLTGFQFDRVYLVLPFGMAVAAGIALSHFPRLWRFALTSGSHYRYGASIQQLALILACAIVLTQSVVVNQNIWRDLVRGSNFATLYQHPDLSELAVNQDLRNPFRVATVFSDGRFAPELHPSYAWAYGLETVDGYVVMYPQRYQDYWGRVIAAVTAKDTHIREYFHQWGNRVYLFPSEQSQFNDGALRFADYFDLDLLSLANVKYIISAFPLEDKRLALLPSATRDRLLAQGPQRFRNRVFDTLRGDYAGIPLYIYENQTVLPRFFLVHRAEVHPTHDEVLDAVDKANRDDLLSTAYLAQIDAEQWLLDGVGTGQVVVEFSTPDEISLRIHTDADAILVVANSYNPFWRAWIDGDVARLFPVDYAFQGVHVGAGQHELTLRYAPPYAVKWLCLNERCQES